MSVTFSKPNVQQGLSETKFYYIGDTDDPEHSTGTHDEFDIYDTVHTETHTSEPCSVDHFGSTQELTEQTSLPTEDPKAPWISTLRPMDVDTDKPNVDVQEDWDCADKRDAWVSHVNESEDQFEHGTT